MDIVGDYVIVIQHSAVTLFKKRKIKKIQLPFMNKYDVTILRCRITMNK